MLDPSFLDGGLISIETQLHARAAHETIVTLKMSKHRSYRTPTDFAPIDSALPFRLRLPARDTGPRACSTVRATPVLGLCCPATDGFSRKASAVEHASSNAPRSMMWQFLSVDILDCCMRSQSFNMSRPHDPISTGLPLLYIVTSIRRRVYIQGMTIKC